jgi:hypothetical protein
MTEPQALPPKDEGQAEADRRREFLRRYGALATLVPPTIAAILRLETTPAEAAGSSIGGGRPPGPPPGPPPPPRPRPN